MGTSRTVGGQGRAKGSTTGEDVGMAKVCPGDLTGGRQELGRGGREGVSGHRLSFSLPSSPPQMLGGGLDDLRLPVFLKLIIKKKRKLKKRSNMKSSC